MAITCAFIRLQEQRFAAYGNFVALRHWYGGKPFQITNKGLRVKLPLLLERSKQMSSSRETYTHRLGALGCHDSEDTQHALAIPLVVAHRVSNELARGGGKLHRISIEVLIALSHQNSLGSQSRIWRHLEAGSLKQCIYVRNVHSDLGKRNWLALETKFVSTYFSTC
jgi:hypothetical protein